jgi:hypothetical protein
LYRWDDRRQSWQENAATATATAAAAAAAGITKASETSREIRVNEGKLLGVRCISATIGVNVG